MPVIILDGGLGRQLSENGAPFRQPEWSALALMEAPHTVREVHDQFIAAEDSKIAKVTELSREDLHTKL